MGTALMARPACRDSRANSRSARIRATGRPVGSAAIWAICHGVVWWESLDESARMQVRVFRRFLGAAGISGFVRC